VGWGAHRGHGRGRGHAFQRELRRMAPRDARHRAGARCYRRPWSGSVSLATASAARGVSRCQACFRGAFPPFLDELTPVLSIGHILSENCMRGSAASPRVIRNRLIEFRVKMSAQLLGCRVGAEQGSSERAGTARARQRHTSAHCAAASLKRRLSVRGRKSPRPPARSGSAQFWEPSW
jgi:hypothetical protein